MVATGKADFECANTTQTHRALASVDFSNLIFVDGGGFLVKSGLAGEQGDRPGRQEDRRAGRHDDRVAPERHAEAAPRERDGHPDQRTPTKAWRCWSRVSVDAYAGDKIKLVGLAAQAKEPAKLAMLAEDLSIEPYALALPRSDSALRLEVNKALTQVYMGGDIEAIFAQWLGKIGRPSGLLAAMYLLNSIPD